MNWLYYLLESNLYLVLFYGFYKLFLHKETFYAINRYYLIFSSLTAFILPFFQLGFLKNTVPVDTSYPIFPQTDPINFNTFQIPTTVTETFFNTSNITIIIYLSITSLLLLRLVISLISLINLRKNTYTVLENGISLIALKESKHAFSFFNLLFIDPQLAEQSTILKHELVHIKQKHSIDVIYFEILNAVNWFNPIAYFIKNNIRLIHEYIADEETTKHGVEKYDYSLFLIQNSSGIQNLTLTNQIFSSSTLKKRISMLNQKKSANWASLRLLLALPLVGAMLCASTMAFTKNYGYIDLLPEKASLQKALINDSDESTAREILTKSDLIVTKLIPSKTNKDSANVVAESTDMFKVILHNLNTGKSVVEFDWSIIPNDFNFSKIDICYKGSEEYEMISKAIIASKKLNQQLKKRKFGDIDKIQQPSPTVIPVTKTEFYPLNIYKVTEKEPISIEPRYIVVNEKGVEDNSKIGGYTNAKSIKYLSPSTAIKKYGNEKGKNGAVEITGNNIKYLKRVMNTSFKNKKMTPPLPMVSLPKAQAEGYRKSI